MKSYITPTINIVELDTEEVIAQSNIGFDQDPSTDFSPEIRRGTGWTDYEN